MKYFFLILIAASFSGCEFFRKAQRQSSSNTAVSKQIDTASKVDSSVTKKQSEYEKTTYVFPVNARDTNITNNYFPDYPAMPRPTVIIQEKGKAEEQTNTFNYEAWFKWKIDSLAATQKQSTVTTKASLLGFWELFAIGAVVILALIVWFKVGK